MKELTDLRVSCISVKQNNVYKPYNIGPSAGTEALLTAINYARTNPDQSDLRKLIREVIAAGR